MVAALFTHLSAPWLAHARAVVLALSPFPVASPSFLQLAHLLRLPVSVSSLTDTPF